MPREGTRIVIMITYSCTSNEILLFVVVLFHVSSWGVKKISKAIQTDLLFNLVWHILYVLFSIIFFFFFEFNWI